MQSCSMWYFEIGFVYLAQHIWDPSKLLLISVIGSFLLMNGRGIPKLFNHLPIERYLHCFQSLEITVKLLWTILCNFLNEHVFILLDKCPRMQRLGGLFSFLGNYQTVFQNDHTSYQQCMIDSAFPHSHQHLVLSQFFILAL